MMPLSSFLNMNIITQFSFCLAAFMGIEVTAVHARDFANPKKQIPLGIGFTALATAAIMAIVSLVVLKLLGNQAVSINTALVDSVLLIMQKWQLSFWQPLLVVLIVMGPIAGLTTWIISPVRTLHATFVDLGILTKFIGKAKDGAPKTLLIVQAIIVSMLTSSYFIFDMFELIELMSIALVMIYMLAYLLMFWASILLNKSDSGHLMPLWLVRGTCLIGLASTIMILVAGAALTIDMLIVKSWMKSLVVLLIVVSCYYVPDYLWSMSREH